MKTATARKPGICEYGRKETGGPICRNPINKGDKYVVGDIDPYRAGGFGHSRWCLECGKFHFSI